MIEYPNPDIVPTKVKNTALKYAYTYIGQELLRLRHNEEGAKFRNGDITEAEWQTFLTDWFSPRRQIITDDLVELRQTIKDYVIQFKDKISLEDILN